MNHCQDCKSENTDVVPHDGDYVRECQDCGYVNDVGFLPPFLTEQNKARLCAKRARILGR